MRSILIAIALVFVANSSHANPRLSNIRVYSTVDNIVMRADLSEPGGYDTAPGWDFRLTFALEAAHDSLFAWVVKSDEPCAGFPNKAVYEDGFRKGPVVAVATADSLHIEVPWYLIFDGSPRQALLWNIQLHTLSPLVGPYCTMGGIYQGPIMGIIQPPTIARKWRFR